MHQQTTLLKLCALLLCVHLSVGTYVHPRSTWTQRSLAGVKRMSGPAQYVIIHHTGTPQCHNHGQCYQRLRSIQAGHIRRKFPDIGYNFLIGSDGSIYEGVGYGYKGSHAPGYNSKSYGIAFIGNFHIEQPSQSMLQSAKQLIAHMVNTRRVQSNYKLLGHRQLKNTACPGGNLYAHIQKWPRWSPKP